MVTGQRLSVEDYLALPEAKPYLEYLDGEVVAKVAPDFRHMVLARYLILRLADYERDHGGISGPEGRVEFRGDDGTFFRLPDVAYWAEGRALHGSDAMAPPTLAIEIRSPGQGLNDLRERCAFFLTHGADAALLIDPETHTAICMEGGVEASFRDAGIVRFAAMPGFALDVAALFESLPD